MKPVSSTFFYGNTVRTLNLIKWQYQKSFFRNVTTMWVAAFMAIAPMIGARADGGAMVIQYEFSLNKKAKFRQINLAYRSFSEFGSTQPFHSGETAGPGVIIPLYSINTRSPGMFNLLFDSEWQQNAFGLDTSESNDSKIGSTIAALLITGGVVGLVAYAVSEASENGCSDGEIGLSLLTPGGNLDWCQDGDTN